MKKQITSTAMAVMVAFSSFATPSLANGQSNPSATLDTVALLSSVKKDVDATASYVINTLKSSIDNIDYNYFKNYLLALRSGNSDAKLESALLGYLDTHFTKDGPTGFSDDYTFYPNTWYPYIITFLNEDGKNPADYNGINFCSLFENSYLAEGSETNIYMQSYIVDMVKKSPASYVKAEEIITTAENSVLASYVSDDSGTGIDYWGVSVDNNGQCLPALKYVYSTDVEVKAKVDSALLWTAAQFNPDTNAIVSWGSDNVDSTALAIKAFSTYGDLENAARAYEGLSAFKSTTSGAYLHDGSDNSYATIDALDGLTSLYTELHNTVGHIYSATPVFIWAADYSKATATFNCMDCNTSKVLDCKINVSTKNATCTASGLSTYTASISFEGKNYTDIKTKVIKAKGHTPGSAKIENFVPATTKKNGSYNTVTRCKICNAILSTKATLIKKIASVKLVTSTYTYNGKNKKPSVKITDSAGKVLKKGTDYTLTYPSSSKNVGSYSVKVTFKGIYSGTKTLTYKVLPAAPSKVKATSKKTSIKLSWKKQTSNVSGFNIYLAKNSKFTKSLKKKTVASSKASATFSALSKNTKYYIKIRSYKTVKVNGKTTKLYSKWITLSKKTAKK